MFEKMSDGDIMVYLRNVALQVSKLAQERGLIIRMRCDEEGCISVRADDYEVFQYDKDSRIMYDYSPLESGGWKHDVQPQRIRFGQEPREEENGKAFHHHREPES